MKYDVVVIGGGVSGAAAGISAARQGSKTLIIEKEAFLGGTLTSCGVGPMMTFHAGNKQVIKGIMEEIVLRLKDRGQTLYHVKDTLNCVPYQTPFNSEGLKLLLDEMTEEANCDVLFHTQFAGCAVEKGVIKSVKVCNKNGLYDIEGDVFIDASGDADLAVSAGIPTVFGRENSGVTQPMTLNMKYCNVDTDMLRKAVIDGGKDEFPSMHLNLDTMKNTNHLALGGYHTEFSNARKNGEVNIPRDDILIFETEKKGEYIVNTTRINKFSPIDAMSLSKAEMSGRKQCAELDKFFKAHVPAFKKAILEYTGPNIGVRSSRQIVGKYTLSEDDLFSLKKFDDTICHSAYPIDVHSPEDGSTYRKEFEGEDFYSIPYSTMYNENFDNYIACGRCVSSTFVAQSAIRVTPSAGAIGQAAGIAATIACKDKKIVGKIDVEKLQKKLIECGAFLDLKA